MGGLGTGDEFTIAHGGLAVRLRPSLRAAMRLERLHDGYPSLFTKLGEFDTATVRAVILAAATDRTAAEALLGAMARLPLAAFHQAASDALAGLCRALLLPDTDTAPKAKPAKPITWAEAYVELYRIGTGWLGWTPTETWAATPAEIAEAFEGHIARFKAQHGIADDKQSDATDPEAPDDEFDRAGFDALRASLM